LRYLVRALDVTGAALFTCGACGLAYMVHPFVAACVGGVLLLVSGAVVERGKR
jgi:hypothetical protein